MLLATRNASLDPLCCAVDHIVPFSIRVFFYKKNDGNTAHSEVVVAVYI